MLSGIVILLVLVLVVIVLASMWSGKSAYSRDNSGDSSSGYVPGGSIDYTQHQHSDQGGHHGHDGGGSDSGGDCGGGDSGGGGGGD
jgi:uncharacterized membrane protein YgcG